MIHCIPIARARDLFEYHTDGYLVRKLTGKRASICAAHGYTSVSIDGKLYREHRVIWAMHHDRQPECVIDHINTVRNDNRLHNLRDVSHSDNNRNRRPNGLTEDPKTKMFIASYWKYRLGSYPTIELAHLAHALCAAHGIRPKMHPFVTYLFAPNIFLIEYLGVSRTAECPDRANAIALHMARTMPCDLI